MSKSAVVERRGSMAKDDYYVIVYKIPAYLYVQLNTGEQVNQEMIRHDGKIFSMNENY